MHTSTVKILGAKAVDFKPTDGSGRHYDHVQLFCQIPMDLSQGNAIGNGCETFNWQDSANIALLRKFKQADFPLEAKITFDMVTSGKGVKYVVCDVELPQVPKATV
ncbi:hypothetical protein [Acinetobacter proteolyticus]|uniref:hypothetical protein n=1 Tax=Acinetobacter proteolyticus TaxID=1776741 RepID=UPI003D970099